MLWRNACVATPFRKCVVKTGSWWWCATSSAINAITYIRLRVCPGGHTQLSYSFCGPLLMRARFGAERPNVYAHNCMAEH